METNPISDEEILIRLRRHPQIRSRMASLLGAVEDAPGEFEMSRRTIRKITQKLETTTAG